MPDLTKKPTMNDTEQPWSLTMPNNFTPEFQFL